jgi:cell division septum initiation protein DivIVA
MNRLAPHVFVLALLLPIVALAQTPSKALGPAPAGSPATDITVRPTPPPIPDPPADHPPPRPGPGRETAPAPDVRSPLVADDPFQQVPRDRAESADDLVRASAAFADKRYAQAATLFGEADRHKERFTDAQREQWAYCRLHGVAVQLNSERPAPMADLKGEVESAMQAGSARLKPFGNQLLAEIGKRDVAPASDAIPSGWQALESGSFRVLYKSQTALAGEVSRTAESARKDMYERWAGPAGSHWSPRCDIYVHPSSAEYAKATGKPAGQPGHSTVGTRAGQVVSRRIDLCADDETLLDGSVPSEVTQVLVADLFADQPIPRWARIGMAALSESPESVARYQRAVPGLLREKKLFSVGPFLDQTNFPDAAAITPFYAESVSLVSYLVQLKGPKAFTAFLREAPRRGYARALTTHYGFKDAADLQDHWVKHSLGAE